MEIKQDYKDEEGHHVNFTFVGETRGVTFDGSSVRFIDGDEEVVLFVTEIEALIPYFKEWIEEWNRRGEKLLLDGMFK